MTQAEKSILTILKTNARATVADLAKLVGISEAEVSATVTHLEKSGVIVQYTAIVNEEKLDVKSTVVRALIEVKVQPEKKSGFDAIARRICRHPNVVDHFLMSGGFDFLIVVEGESLQEISAFVSDKLASIENVRGTMTHFIMKKYKENGVVIEETSEQDRLVVSP